LNRTAHVLIQTTLGRGATRQFPVQRLESYTTETALDKDTDSWSVSIGDPQGELLYITDRDVEARATIYLSNEAGRIIPIFSGVCDDVTFGTESQSLDLSGRDMSALAIDSDVPPGRWRHIKPAKFIQKRAHALGLTNTSIHSMREIGTLISDASETEWELWYRMVRSRDMFMWTGPLGALFIRPLNNADKATYFFGKPAKGDTRGKWDMPEGVAVHTSKQRKAEVWVYGEDQKTGTPFYAKSVDPTIKNWKRKPLSIVTSSTAKSNQDAKEDADEEVYESIVGAYQIELVLHDRGQLYQQNQMARLRLPEPLDHLNGLYFVVGVTRAGGADGFTQVVRLRERGFAVSKRVPDPPKITQPNDAAQNKVPSSISSTLAQAMTDDGRQVPWSDAFQQAAREFGSNNGWDYATFLAVLLAICEHESHFHNVRGSVDGAINGVEWSSFEAFKNNANNWQTDPLGAQAATPEGHEVGPATAVDARHLYSKTFANAQRNPDNPRYPSNECAVGPMQLVTPEYKDWADGYGWNGVARKGELDGGRWNPRSNIRAAARALAGKLAVPPAANPNDARTIRIGIERYYGSRDPGANSAYGAAVMKAVDTKWLDIAKTAVAASQTLPTGTQTKTTIDGVTYEAPANTPDEVKKALNFCLRRRGEPYQWAGSGPYYDCSSLVTAAYASASPELRAQLDEPSPGNHGETTYTLARRESNGRLRFPEPPRDSLLPGDLVFFHHGGSTPEHVGMYMGDGKMIHDPSTGDVIKVSSIAAGYYADHYWGARRLVDWTTATVTRDPAAATSPAKPPSGNIFAGTAKRIMIQAGHDTGSHNDQPYSHEGESGTAGEQAFTIEVRDKVLALLDQDDRFSSVKGDAWNASAGATASTTDDINFTGDMFISLHYDRGTAGSGFFFGYTRGATDGRPASVTEQSAKLANQIANFIAAVPDAPPRLTDNVGFGGTPSGAAGWGYYAWGSDLRAAPDNVDHTPGVSARIIIELGRASDGTYLDTQRERIAKAIYLGICNYYGVKPTS
jgi:cell wall-associated NlpC family hydrolase